MEIIEEVKNAVKDEFPGGEIVEVEYDKRSHKVSGFLVWEGFDTLDHLDRQRKLWDVLRSKLGTHSSSISFIFTYTPREYRAMTAH